MLQLKLRRITLSLRKLKDNTMAKGNKPMKNDKAKMKAKKVKDTDKDKK